MGENRPFEADYNALSMLKYTFPRFLIEQFIQWTTSIILALGILPTTMQKKSRHVRLRRQQLPPHPQKCSNRVSISETSNVAKSSDTRWFTWPWLREQRTIPILIHNHRILQTSW
jgi:hypothetical protein